jgi:hypothetical protein
VCQRLAKGATSSTVQPGQVRRLLLSTLPFLLAGGARLLVSGPF